VVQIHVTIAEIDNFSLGTVFIDRVAGAIIRLVVSVCVSVDALLFEPFDL